MNPFVPTVLACFFCGVDSKALLYFLLVFVVSIVLASLAFLIWAVAKGDFQDIEAAKYEIFNDPEAQMPEAVSAPPLVKPRSAKDENKC